MSQSFTCSGTTLKGFPCAARVTGPGQYCHRHGPPAVPGPENTSVYPPREDLLGLPLNPEEDLFPHQRHALQFAYEKQTVTGGDHLGLRGVLLRLNQGLGKTLIAFCLMLLNHVGIPTHQTSLYITTKSGMNEAVDQIKKFFGASVKYYVFHNDFNPGCDLITYDQLKQYQIVITNHDMISGLYSDLKSQGVEYGVQRNNLGMGDGEPKIVQYAHPGTWPEDTARRMVGRFLLEFFPWNTVILDESHKISNVKTLTFRGAMGLAAFFFHCLSGTPMKNEFEDLYAQFKFMGYRPFGTSAFRGDYVGQQLDRWIVDMTYETAGIQLPVPIMRIHEVELTGRSAVVYDVTRRSAIKSYHEMQSGIFSSNLLLVAITRLRQLAMAPCLICGTIEDPEYGTYSDLNVKQFDKEIYEWIRDKDGTAGIKSPKMTTTLATLNSIPDNEPTIIFCTMKEPLELLIYGINKYKERGLFSGKRAELFESKLNSAKRKQMLTNFRNGTTNVLMMTYKIGAESLNLTNGIHCIFLDQWWAPSTGDQAFSRIWRLGNQNVVTKHMFLAKDTVDWTILKVQKAKMDDIRRQTGGNGGVTNAGLTSDLIANILGITEIDPVDEINQGLGMMNMD